MSHAAHIQYRPIGLLLLLIGEVLLISLNFDALSLANVGDGNELSNVLAFTGGFAKLLMVGFAALLVVTQPRFRGIMDNLMDYPVRQFVPIMALHLVVYLCFYAATAVLFSEPRVIPQPTPIAVLAWVLSGICLITTWAMAMAPRAFWLRVFIQERSSFVVAGLVGLAAWSIAYSSQDLWAWLAHDSLWLAHSLLALIFDGVFVDFDTQTLGLLDFAVTIGIPCSGYEGIGLVSIFVSLYLWLFRSELRFPHALLLLPLGIITIWLFNVLRIAVLVTLGAHVSPDLALGGFHSQAGWISFLIVSVGVLYLAQKSSFAHRDHVLVSDDRGNLDLASATLIPFVALLILAMVTSALTSGFDWLYPLRVIGTGAAIMICWKTINIPIRWARLEPILMGVLVFLVWILAVENIPSTNGLFNDSLQQMGSGWAMVWLLFRVAGSIVIAPVVEELAFRGYLLCKLSKQPVTVTGTIRFSWTALIVSSLLFGLIHTSWIVGAVAGLAYAVVRYRSDSIWAPIVAHMVTNALLTLFVMSTGQWSVW